MTIIEALKTGKIDRVACRRAGLWVYMSWEDNHFVVRGKTLTILLTTEDEEKAVEVLLGKEK